MSDLRSRRKAEMAQVIQQATIDLSRDYGFDAITTEMISQQAGISARTFFNYYANKEAALFGQVPFLTDEICRTLVPGSGFLADDLYQLLRAMMMRAVPRKAELAIIVPALQTQPKVLKVYMAERAAMSERLAQMLEDRLPESTQLFRAVLAEMLMSASWNGIMAWLENRVTSDMALEQGWRAICEIAQLFVGPEAPGPSSP
ncbi:TetR/AcrR family transcriptional regulator (plasmid) [Thioclava litoralis]|uniref:TetR/AcrR family transcriptional regulator n=1 Tax=Thioclava litoralis TaxID=3076557 RepID=A0ABZ1E6I3_9RHOB|nr:TetR/AcrR family transcriptional regulator [Thioclava sp. FTW29]